MINIDKIDFSQANQFFSDFFDTNVEFHIDKNLISENPEDVFENHIVPIVSNDLSKSNKLLELTVVELTIFSDAHIKDNGTLVGNFLIGGTDNGYTGLVDTKIASYVYKNGRWDIKACN